MKRILLLIVLSTLILSLAACGGAPVTQAPAPTEAVPPAADTATPAPAAAPLVTPTLVPTEVVDASVVTQEELAGEIDKSIQEAETAYAEVETYAAEVVVDGVLTAEEAQELYYLVYYASYYIDDVEYLLSVYDEYYGEYADDYYALLVELEADLESMATDLDEIAAILEQGSEAATAALEQLNTALMDASTKLEALQTKANSLPGTYYAAVQQRIDTILNITAMQDVVDLDDALGLTQAFADAFNTALSDGKISPDELSSLGQFGANAAAGWANEAGGGIRGNVQEQMSNLVLDRVQGMCASDACSSFGNGTLSSLGATFGANLGNLGFGANGLPDTALMGQAIDSLLFNAAAGNWNGLPSQLSSFTGGLPVR